MSKYWLSLLLFGVFLGAIPVISIGWISYSISSADIEEKVKEGNMQVLHQTQMRVEQLLKMVEMAAFQFANSSAIATTLSEQLEAANFDEIRALSRGISHIYTFPGVADARIINIENDWQLSMKMFSTFDSLTDKEQLIEYGANARSLFWVNPAAGQLYTDTEDEQGAPTSVLRMVMKVPTMPITTNPRAMITIDVMSNEIHNYLNRSDSLGLHYIIERDGTNILSDPSVDYYQAINRDIVARVGSGHAEVNEGFFTAYSGNEEMGVMYRVSPYNNWVYVSVVSIHDINKQSRKIAAITALVCLAVIVLVGLLAFYGSRRMYSPVRKLFEYTLGMEEDTGGAKQDDEFQFIESSLRKLSDTGKELQCRLQGQFAQLKEFFVLKLFAGQFNESDYSMNDREYGFPANWSRLAVLTLQIDTLEGTRYAERDRELLLYAINNMVGEIIPAGSRLTPIVMNHSQVTVMTSINEDPGFIKHELHRAAELIQSKVGEYLQLKVSIGISRSYDRLDHTMKAYGETQQALRRRLSLGYEIIVHYEDIDSHHELGSAIYSHLKVLEDQLIHAIKMGDTERVDALFQDYLDAIIHKEVSFNEYPALMIQLISKVYQVIQEQGSSINKVLGERATVEHYMKLNTIEEISAWFRKDLFYPVIHYLNDQAETQYLDIANQMVKLIHERYDEDITLEFCASILIFHPVYLSRVFKKEVGITFSEYLMDYRMNVAKKLLETTNLKISDIAEKLRYTNTSAFIRTFRRIVGTTPGQYREQYIDH